MAVSVPRRLFTVDEYYEMARVGILKPGERVELLDGEIVPKNPIGSPHAWCVNRLMEAFAPLLGPIRLSVQNPLRLGATSEPEPDIVMLRPDTPQDRHPGPRDALLVIEVADTSIRVDRGRKLLLYARAGIPEYWIVDLSGRRVEMYRDPAGRRYRSVARHEADATVSPLHLPALSLSVSYILGA